MDDRFDFDPMCAPSAPSPTAAAVACLVGCGMAVGAVLAWGVLRVVAWVAG